MYLAQNVLVARLLGPALVGLWEGISLVSLYNVTHFGVLNAIHRQIPIARGQGEQALVARLRDQGFVAALGPSSLLGIIILAFAALNWDASSDYRLGLLGLAVLVVVQQLQSLYQILLRTDNRFHALSISQLAMCLLAVIHLGLVAALGFAGQVLGAILVPLSIALFMAWLGAYRLRLALEPRLYWQLIREGIPIALMLFSDALLLGVDRVLILTLLGATELGYYRVTVLASGVLLFLPGVLSQMLYPRMGERFGATQDVRSLRGLFETSCLGLAHVLPLLLGGLYLLLPALVAVGLPAFTPGVAPARWVLLGLLTVPLFGMATYVLIIGERALEVVAAQLCGALVKAVLGGGAALLGQGLEGVAIGVAAGYAVYASWLFRRGTQILAMPQRDALSLAVRVLSPSAVALILMVALDRVVDSLPSQWPMVASDFAAAAIFGVIYGSLASIWLRRTSPQAWMALAVWRRSGA